MTIDVQLVLFSPEPHKTLAQGLSLILWSATEAEEHTLPFSLVHSALSSLRPKTEKSIADANGHVGLIKSKGQIRTPG